MDYSVVFYNVKMLFTMNGAYDFCSQLRDEKICIVWSRFMWENHCKPKPIQDYPNYYKITPPKGAVVSQSESGATCFKGICWMKIVNITSFEHGAPPSVISAFYWKSYIDLLEQTEKFQLEKKLSDQLWWLLGAFDICPKGTPKPCKKRLMITDFLYFLQSTLWHWLRFTIFLNQTKHLPFGYFWSRVYSRSLESLFDEYNNYIKNLAWNCSILETLNSC